MSTFTVRVLVKGAHNAKDAEQRVSSKLKDGKGLVVLDAYPWGPRKQRSVLSMLFFG